METSIPSENFEDKFPERPLGCHECKKMISVRYTEMAKNEKIELCMCSDCPELTRKLKGVSTSKTKLEEATTSLTCGDCGTPLESLRVGQPLGCSHCYIVFEDPLLAELKSADKLPSKIQTTTIAKKAPLHSGRIPGQPQELNPTLRLLALNEALSETLKKEDYEQAAWLRDQIKALTDETPKGSP